MKNPKILGLLTALIILFFDHLTKYWVVATLPLGTVIPVFPSFFDLVHVRNTGAAFGFLAGWDSQHKNLFFYALSLVAFFLLLRFLKSIPPKSYRQAIPIGLILGGALGNVLDRILRGSVVDFLSLHWNNQVLALPWGENPILIPLVWPAFNIADAGITVGVIWLLVSEWTLANTRKK